MFEIIAFLSEKNICIMKLKDFDVLHKNCLHVIGGTAHLTQTALLRVSRCLI